jgi:hypothetical protein
MRETESAGACLAAAARWQRTRTAAVGVLETVKAEIVLAVVHPWDRVAVPDELATKKSRVPLANAASTYGKADPRSLQLDPGTVMEP